MNRRKEISLMAAGLLAGIAVSGPATQAVAGLMANPSTQTFRLDGQCIHLEAYSINGNNYVKLRDIGQAVNFGVTYDAARNTVIIHPNEAYTEEVKASTKNVMVPQDGSQYIPKAGDVIPCGDGPGYAVTDVSRSDRNAFASGPAGPLPEPACDWSQFDQPQLPAAEVRRFNDQDGDYLFVRNLYETRRMLYTLYNAMADNPKTWQDGEAVRRSDGTPWVHIHLSMPEGVSPAGFWPWRAERVTELLDSCPAGDYYLDVWDVYRNGIFQRTEYQIY